MITWLTSHGLSDEQIQIISDNKSKKSLEVFQHLALNTVEHGYQEAVRSIGICYPPMFLSMMRDTRRRMRAVSG